MHSLATGSRLRPREGRDDLVLVRGAEVDFVVRQLCPGPLIGGKRDNEEALAAAFVAPGLATLPSRSGAGSHREGCPARYSAGEQRWGPNHKLGCGWQMPTPGR